MQRLESKTVHETEKSLTVQGEIDRMRSMRVDDAILIEKLKSQQCEVQDQLNEIIGVMQAFAHHIEAHEAQSSQRQRTEH